MGNRRETELEKVGTRQDIVHELVLDADDTDADDDILTPQDEPATDASPGSKAAARTSRSGREVHERELDATRIYLSEIGFSPLLTAQEEVHYARLAQAGDEAGRRRMA